MTDPATQSPKQAPPPRQNGVHLSRPMIIGLLYLLSIVVVFSPIVGVVLAYIWRGDGQSQQWEDTHFTYAIRTFWISLIMAIALIIVWFGILFSMMPSGPRTEEQPDFFFFGGFFIAFASWALLLVWFYVRTALSVARAAKEQPMPKPQSWLF